MSDESNPVKKSFDCVAFQRAQRKKLGKKFETMTSEEIGAWMRDYRPTDPKLRLWSSACELAMPACTSRPPRTAASGHEPLGRLLAPHASGSSLSRRSRAPMTKEEQMDFPRNVEITDPILRRIRERSPRVKLLPLRLLPGTSEKQASAPTRATEPAQSPPRRGSPFRDGRAREPEPRARRVYVDTSVFQGCESKMFRATSLRLFERFRDGDISLVLSALVAKELDSASAAVRAVLGPVPPEHLEFLEPSADAEELADRYIDAGAVDTEMRPVALHVAFATLARVDALASWDYKHLLNFRRSRKWNVVNRELGHPHLPIHEVPAVLGEWGPRSGQQGLRLRGLPARAAGPHQPEARGNDS